MGFYSFLEGFFIVVLYFLEVGIFYFSWFLIFCFESFFFKDYYYILFGERILFGLKNLITCCLFIY